MAELSGPMNPSLFFMEKRCLPRDMYSYSDSKSYGECMLQHTKANTIILAIILVIVLLVCTYIYGIYGAMVVLGVGAVLCAISYGYGYTMSKYGAKQYDQMREEFERWKATVGGDKTLLDYRDHLRKEAKRAREEAEAQARIDRDLARAKLDQSAATTLQNHQQGQSSNQTFTFGKWKLQ